MPGVDATRRVSKTSIDKPEDISRELDKVYEDLADGINSKSDTVILGVSPTINDYRFSIGTIWVDKSTDAAFILTNYPDVHQATWTQIT